VPDIYVDGTLVPGVESFVQLFLFTVAAGDYFIVEASSPLGVEIGSPMGSTDEEIYFVTMPDTSGVGEEILFQDYGVNRVNRAEYSITTTNGETLRITEATTFTDGSADREGMPSLTRWRPISVLPWSILSRENYRISSVTVSGKRSRSGWSERSRPGNILQAVLLSVA
jgi:hypothetical protein